MLVCVYVIFKTCLLLIANVTFMNGSWVLLNNSPPPVTSVFRLNVVKPLEQAMVPTSCPKEKLQRGAANDDTAMRLPIVDDQDQVDSVCIRISDELITQD